MKASARSSKFSEVKFSNGRHNPEVTPHWEDQYFKLYPEQRACMEKSQAKSKKKAKKAAASDDQSSTGTTWHIVKKAHFSLDHNTAYLESGSSHHMISSCDFFSTYTESWSKIELADSKSTISPGFGNVHVKTKDGGILKLECLQVPDLVGNLILLSCLWKRGCDLV